MEARSEINRRLGMDSIIAAGRASLAHGDPESGVALYTLLERGERPEANGGADGAAIR